MKILFIEIIKTGDTWTATIANGNGLRVHIEGCETKEIAQEQADERVKELKAEGIIK